MHSEQDFADRLDRLEQPYRAMSQAIAQGVLIALKESGLSIQPPQNVNYANTQGPVEAINEAAVAAIRDTLPNVPGVCSIVGALPHAAVISEQGLAKMFSKHPASIKAAVDRGELPPPIRFMGKPTWTVGAVVKHFEKRLEAAEKESERLRRIGRPRP
jgi:hypothetical protein